MKVASFLVIATFGATAASAFGLHGVANVAKAAAPVGFARNNKPMVQALDIHGNARNNSVSILQCRCDFWNISEDRDDSHL